MKLNRIQIRRLIESTILEQEIHAAASNDPEKITITYQAETDQYTVPANSEKVFYVYIDDGSDAVNSGNSGTTSNTANIGFKLNGKLFLTKPGQVGFSMTAYDGYEIKRNAPNELIIKNHGNEDFNFTLVSNDGP